VRRHARHRGRLFIAALLAPLAIVFGWKFGVVALQAWQSLWRINFAKPWVEGFAGLENYAQAFDDPVVAQAAFNSLVWTIGSVVPQAVLGMALALLLNRSFPLRDLARTLALSPWAVSAVAGAMMWAWMLNGPFGVINGVLMDFGLIERRIAWLSDPDWAMGGVILANVWRGVPFFAIAFLAAMQAIPEEIYEAAEIDGVNAWQRFAYVTLPMLRGVIAVTVLLRTVWTFNWVETIFAMTNGGPAHATTTLPMYVFEQFFRFSDVGYASALAIMLFGSLLLFAAAYIRLSRMSEAAGR
jgi:multiple sugar transport system permease protein